MPAITATAATPRRILGDLAERTYTLSGNNGDTFTPTQQSDIEAVFATPTTAIAVGVTRSGNTLTFVTAGAWAAQVTVLSRVG